MALGDETDQRQLDRFALALDHLLDVFHQLAERLIHESPFDVGALYGPDAPTVPPVTMEPVRPRGSTLGFACRSIGAVLMHPSLWPTALGQLGRMIPRSWWRRAPYLPIPDGDYLRFRLVTQYGATGPMDPDDVVIFLRWCRSTGR